MIPTKKSLLNEHIKVFFIEFNDPNFIKYQKLQILKLLSDEKNASFIIQELLQYIYDTNQEFARSSLELLGSMTIAMQDHLEICMTSLVKLTQFTQYQIIKDEIVIILQLLQRKYPHNIIIGQNINLFIQKLKLCAAPKAQISYLWLLGNFGDQIENINLILLPFIEEYVQLENSVKL